MTDHPLLQALRSGQAPEQARLAAARGLLPLPPLEGMIACWIVRGGEDEAIRTAAEAHLRELADEQLIDILEEETLPPDLLEYLARQRADREKVIEFLVLNDSTPDPAIEWLAGQVGPRILELIILNQVRLQRTPGIVQAVERNPKINIHVQRRLKEIQTLIKYERLRTARVQAKEEEAQRLVQELAQEQARRDQEAALAAMAQQEAAVAEEAEAAPAPEPATFEELLAQAEEALKSPPPPLPDGADEETKSAYQKILQMSVTQRIQLALKGTGEERAILIRDSNKLVSEAVLKSPKLNESEVSAYAQMPSLSPDLLKGIAENRDWAKHYSIISSLVKNPKVPIATNMNLMARLTNMDLKNLTRNRNVPEQVRRHAVQLHQKRTQRKTRAKH